MTQGLCIGGPIDGQYRDIPPTPTFNVVVAKSLPMRPGADFAIHYADDGSQNGYVIDGEFIHTEALFESHQYRVEGAQLIYAGADG